MFGKIRAVRSRETQTLETNTRKGTIGALKFVS